MTPNEERKWKSMLSESLLDAFAAPLIEELGNGFADADPAASTALAILPPITFVVTVKAPTAHILLDAWTHYLDHDCLGGWETVEDFFAYIMHSMGERAMGPMGQILPVSPYDGTVSEGDVCIPGADEPFDWDGDEEL